MLLLNFMLYLSRFKGFKNFFYWKIRQKYSVRLSKIIIYYYYKDYFICSVHWGSL